MSIIIIAVFAIGFFAASDLALYLHDRKIRIHSLTEEFTAFLDLRIPKLMGLYEMPGASIGLVRDGRVVYTAAYDNANQKSGRKMTVDMPMGVQAISNFIDMALGCETPCFRWHYSQSRYVKND